MRIRRVFRRNQRLATEKSRDWLPERRVNLLTRAIKRKIMRHLCIICRHSGLQLRLALDLLSRAVVPCNQPETSKAPLPRESAPSTAKISGLAFDRPLSIDHSFWVLATEELLKTGSLFCRPPNLGCVQFCGINLKLRVFGCLRVGNTDGRGSVRR